MLPRFLGTGLWLQFDGDLQQFYSRAWRLLSKEEQAAHPMQGSSDHGSPQYLPGSLAADLEEALKSRRAEGQNSGIAGSDGTSSAVNELASLLVQTEKETEPKKNGETTKKKKKKKKKKQTKPKEDL